MTIVGALAACSDPLPPLSWHIGFADGLSSERAKLVEAEIREGDCDGPVVFSSRGVSDGSAAAPGALPAGPYGFFARARDANCLWFAQACVERDLPSTAAIDLTLVSLSKPSRQGECSDDDGPGPAFDAGVHDAGSEDAESDDLEHDGSTQPTSRSDGGAKTPSNDASISPRERPDTGVETRDEARCQRVDETTVACYDFANDLLDRSGFGNHASAQAVTFEPLAELRALRPFGRAVSVADAESLNVAAFTIEVWMRADGLTNLSGDGDEFSLLLDKDRQYSVGIDALGSPVMTIYRDRDRFEHTTATDIALTVGTSYYLAFSYDGVTSRLYVDGRLVDSELIDLPLAAGVNGALFIGSGSPNATRPFDGLIDALRIANVAHAPSQICASANKTFSERGCE